jgi:hypothetical protein
MELVVPRGFAGKVEISKGVLCKVPDKEEPVFFPREKIRVSEISSAFRITMHATPCFHSNFDHDHHFGEEDDTFACGCRAPSDPVPEKLVQHLSDLFHIPEDKILDHMKEYPHWGRVIIPEDKFLISELEVIQEQSGQPREECLFAYLAKGFDVVNALLALSPE